MSDNHTYEEYDDMNSSQENAGIIMSQEEIPSGDEMVSEAPPSSDAASSSDGQSDDDRGSQEAESISGLEEKIENIAQEESNTSHPISLSGAVGGGFIARQVKNNMTLLLLLCVLIIIYINNRYTCQQLMVKINDAENILSRERYKATVCTSELTKESRESNILQLLNSYGDSTLALPSDPPYLIQVPVEEETTGDEK